MNLSRISGAIAPIRRGDLVCWDFWGIIARAYNAVQFEDREPCNKLHKILGVTESPAIFTRRCQTTYFQNPGQYAVDIGRKAGVFNVTDDMKRAFAELLVQELSSLVVYSDALAAIRRFGAAGVINVLVTNSPWPGPVDKVTEDAQLEFAAVLKSCDLGISKNDGIELYEVAATRFGMPFSHVHVIDDNAPLALFPTQDVGMNVILGDREHKYVDADGRYLDAEVEARRIPVIGPTLDALQVQD